MSYSPVIGSHANFYFWSGRRENLTDPLVLPFPSPKNRDITGVVVSALLPPARALPRPSPFPFCAEKRSLSGGKPKQTRLARANLPCLLSRQQAATHTGAIGTLAELVRHDGTCCCVCSVFGKEGGAGKERETDGVCVLFLGVARLHWGVLARNARRTQGTTNTRVLFPVQKV